MINLSKKLREQYQKDFVETGQWIHEGVTYFISPLPAHLAPIANAIRDFR